MGINRSILNDVELESGATVYVQSAVSGRTSISVDDTHTSFSFNLTAEELKKVQAAIALTLAEMEQA